MKRVSGAIALFAALLGAGQASADVKGGRKPPVFRDSLYAPAELPTPTPTLIRAETQFALDLYGRMASARGDLLFSPYSITLALAMSASGARGLTAAEMHRVLHLSDSAAAIGEAYSRYAAQAVGYDGDVLSVGNSLWAQRDFPLRPEFVTFGRRYYGAAVRTVDFVADAGAACRRINAWADAATRGKIPDLVAPGVVNAGTRLVIANAVYFRGKWRYPFQPRDTYPGPFHPAELDSVDVPMMHETAPLRLVRRDDFAMLELPYGPGESMVILLPDDDDGLPKLESALTADRLQDCLLALHVAEPEKVEVTLPKFRCTWAADLHRPLAALGMKAAFDPDSADFSGISPRAGLYLSKVIHKSYIDVDEQGTEAAAATAVVQTLGASYRPDTTPAFVADHPFLYLIRENSDGGILFLGRMADPR